MDELPPFHEEEHTANPIVTFVTGSEGKFLTKQERRNIAILAVASCSTALIHAISVSWIVHLHSQVLILSGCIWIIVFSLLLIVNKSVLVIYRKRNRASVIMAMMYVLLYLLLSGWVIPQGLVYYFLLPDIVAAKTRENSILGEFSAMFYVMDHLTYMEKRALTQYKMICTSVSLIFSYLPLIIHILNLRNEITYFEDEQNKKRLELQKLLLQKKEAYSRIFSDEPRQSADDPFMVEDLELTDQQKLKKAETLLMEIRHIQFALQNIL